MNKIISCGECGAPMVLRKSVKYSKPFWGCSRFPECRGTHGAHADGRPLGIPANQETKTWRMKAHAEFDKIWKERGIKRSQAYTILAAKFGENSIHIAESDIERCKRIIEKSIEIQRELDDQ